MGRIRYCPTCGRTDERDVAHDIEVVGFMKAMSRLCDHCMAWYCRVAPFRAKRSGES